MNLSDWLRLANVRGVLFGQTSRILRPVWNPNYYPVRYVAVTATPIEVKHWLPGTMAVDQHNWLLKVDAFLTRQRRLSTTEVAYGPIDTVVEYGYLCGVQLGLEHVRAALTAQKTESA